MEQQYPQPLGTTPQPRQDKTSSELLTPSELPKFTATASEKVEGDKAHFSTPPSPTAQGEIALNTEQAIAVAALLTFIADPDPASNFFVFSGFAGTGKTFCMREVVARCTKSRVKFAFTAPTNKAAKVLRGVTGSATTIYSLLGLRIDKSGELKQVVAGKAPPDISEFDAIFIDEASMVNKNLMNILRERCQIADVKVVFMGDSAQLPPVGEGHSPVWDEAVGATLTRVMRHDNQILQLVTEVRGVMNHIAPSIVIKSNNSGGEGVWKFSKAAFKESIYNAAMEGKFADGSHGKVIAWRNIRVAEYNNLIRSAIFGSEATEGGFLPGDRVVATAPCQRGDEFLLATDDEALVERVAVCKHPLRPEYKAYELMARTELNKVIRLLVLHPDSMEKFNNDLQQMAHDARSNGKLWKKFWDHQDLFHSVKYAYSLTAHRAQGSTYENVWVDYQDILLNRNRKEAFQCFYVACSRPTTRLYLA